MQKLIRNQKGELIVTKTQDNPESEVKTRSPIVSAENFPAQTVVPTKPLKADMKESLLTEEQLLQKMREAGGKNLSTTQFALLITPNVKKSVDPMKHHKWDIAHGTIRSLMKSLESQGKIVITKDSSSKRVRYLYSLK